ncbi:MAG: winged helix-turn-helix transcriptional regulator [Candidatus Entotheonellia bacterium]
MTWQKGYGQYCPVAKAAEILAERWTPLVVRELLHGSHHFNDLRRGVPLVSASLLSQRLKELEWAGVVVRRQEPEGRSYTYHLTPAGEALRPIIEALGIWGQRFVHSNFEPQDLDPRLLMWDMRRSIRADLLPPRRVLIRFEFPDQPANKRCWWLLKERDDLDLCLQDPGFDVDLTVSVDLRTMTRVWLGDLAIADALRTGALTLKGSAVLRLSFPDWIGLSIFAHM